MHRQRALAGVVCFHGTPWHTVAHISLLCASCRTSTTCTSCLTCISCLTCVQDKYHLYFLFDLMPGGDLMDVLVAEAKVIKFPVAEKGSIRKGCLAPKMKMWQVRGGARRGRAGQGSAGARRGGAGQGKAGQGRWGAGGGPGGRRASVLCCTPAGEVLCCMPALLMGAVYSFFFL